MTTTAGLLLAHELFPSFPPLGLMLVIFLVVGGLIALASKGRAGRNAGSNSSSINPAAVANSETGLSELEEPESGHHWWQLPALRIPLFTFLVCAITVPLSFVPGLNFLASVIQMPGFMVAYALMLNDVLPDDMGQFSFALLCAFVAWVFWTVVATLVSPLIDRFRGEDASPRPFSLR